MSDEKLLQQFVNSFARLSDMLLIGEDFPELIETQGDEDWDRWNVIPTWRPIRVDTPPEALELLFDAIGGGPLPRLYQDLVLSYRWLEVDLKVLVLFANPPGQGLAGLQAVSKHLIR